MSVSLDTTNEFYCPNSLIPINEIQEEFQES